MSRNVDDKLTCILDRFEDSYAVLEFSISGEKQNLNLPKRYLPKGAREQDVLHVKIMTDKQATMDKKELAKNLLDEIISNKG